ncbi:phosphatase PAP2 family protein [Lipingzhangella sp. LS1_29]|uniref:Phosphatase PAP2 family protein n=1 Tax=Lipingzhangella rawalii TaxID=2055835 RepID=A0ABU2H7Y5_9ACTN|nr:phosphatase PAP2 family protein [Lipingzhangella rawalii]MDS1271423.1 phosphatase PAP2 family protein [Lipingzhangella rawalii]
MIHEYRHTRTTRQSVPGTTARATRPTMRDYLVHVLCRLLSDRVTLGLAIALAAMVVLALGPLRPIDTLLNTLPRLESETLRTLLIYWPDTIASRAVALPVLGVVALRLTLWVRSWRPILLAGGSVFAMICLVSAMKLVLARSHPRTHDPSFFVDFGQNFSFPSGHGANAVLIYGIALFLIVRYRAVRPQVAVRLGVAIAGIAFVQSAVSIYLQFHWFSDLVTGMLAGALVLRMAMVLDGLIPEGFTRGWWPFTAPARPEPPLMPAHVQREAGMRHRPAPGRGQRRAVARPIPVRPPARPHSRPKRPSAPGPS